MLSASSSRKWLSRGGLAKLGENSLVVESWTVLSLRATGMQASWLEGDVLKAEAKEPQARLFSDGLVF
jgi:hypothetical protein